MSPVRRRLFAGSIALLLLFVGVFVGYCIQAYSPSSETITSTLQTLVMAQASVLAIVFSVTFVVSQIVSTRYSPAFIKLFVRSPLFREALYLAIGSIIVLLTILGLIPALGTNAKESLFIWMIGVSGAVLVGVVIYIGEFLEQTTPTNLLRHYHAQLTPESYREQSIEAGKNNSLADHPLQPIYDLTRTSIQQDELAVASEGEETIHQITNDVIESQIAADGIDSIVIPDEYEDKYAQSEESERIGLLFTPVLSEYLPRIALSSVEENYIELSQNAVNHIGDLGGKGIQYNNITISDLALISIYNDVMLGIPDPLEEESGQSRVLHTSITNSLDIMGYLIENRDYDLFLDRSSHAYEMMRWVDGVTPKKNLVHNVTIKELIDRQVEWYKKTVSENAKEIEAIDPPIHEMVGSRDRDSIHSNYDPRQHSNSTISILINIRIHMMTITAQHYQSVDWPDDGGTIPMYISGAWRELLVYSFNHPPTASAILLAQRFLETVGYTAVRRGEKSDFEGMPTLTIVLREGGIIPLEIAFDRILKNPSFDDVFGLESFRGLPRHTAWIPFSMENHSDEFLETIKKIRGDVRTKYWNRRFKKGRSNAEILEVHIQYNTDSDMFEID
ncbi:DUF2254 family protein [Halorubrum aethiopicum]|uniref:DUF2254 family protein n=1 Tax=Halorubrum aethiopicum TaxID=1758255 RepID=UPI000AAAD152|nr:DUF2254 family protein [Halorubrum aethiopicum]